jgi:hypothetical protein
MSDKVFERFVETQISLYDKNKDGSLDEKEVNLCFSQKKIVFNSF